MPLHYYVPVQSPCRLCGSGFEHRSGASEPTLTECPKCGQTVNRQVMQSVSAPKLSSGGTVSKAKRAGFAVLKRNSNGDFEKQ